MEIYPKGGCPELEKEEGVSISALLPFEALLDRLSRCHYAYVGFAFRDCDDTTRAYCNIAMPNKLFDAIAAGVPVIVRNCDSVAKMVKDLGIGIVFSGSAGDLLAEATERYAGLRKNVLDVRDSRSGFP